MAIEYVKYNPFRRKKFALKTVIENKSGKLQVKKKSMAIESVDFIREIDKNHQLLTNVYQNLAICDAEFNDNEIIFDYVEGITLQELIIKTIECNDKKGFIDCLYQYKEILTDHGGLQLKRTSDITNEFCSVFGVISQEYFYEYLPVSNIDISFDNLVVSEGKFTMIDYEWVFSFPLPINFIIYRNINTFYNKFKNKIEKNRFIAVEELLKFFDIYENDIQIFSRMEENFQKYVHDDNSSIYNKYLKDIYYLKDLLGLQKRESDNSVAQFFWDNGAGYNEINVLNIDINIQNLNEQSIEFFVSKNNSSIYENCFRIDICKQPCVVKLIDIYGVNSNHIQKLNVFSSNANIADEDRYVFFHDDPQFIFEKIESSDFIIDKIVLKYQFIDLHLFTRELFNKFKDRENELLEVNRKLLEGNSKVIDNNNKLINEKNELTKGNNELINKNIKLIDGNNELISKINELSTTVEKIVNENAQLSAAKNAIINNKNALELELEYNKKKLEEIYASKTWRAVKVMNIVAKIIYFKRK